MYFIALAASISAPALATDVWDFYYPSVKRGRTSAQKTGNEWILESNPGFTASSKMTLTFTGGKPQSARVENKAGKSELKFDPRKPLYSPTHPALLSFLLDRYDVKKKGFQKLAAFDLATRKPRELEAELFRTFERKLDGRQYRLREWRLESPPTAESVIWTDEQNLPCYWWVPSVNYECVRRGYEGLRMSIYPSGEKSVTPSRLSRFVKWFQGPHTSFWNPA